MIRLRRWLLRGLRNPLLAPVLLLLFAVAFTVIALHLGLDHALTSALAACAALAGILALFEALRRGPATTRTAIAGGGFGPGNCAGFGGNLGAGGKRFHPRL
jgi:hypothetical protein